ncbi:MAG TPA: PKD domain-containing protein [Candidatus Eisenbacteria bacterium]|nr:PKD domain-containing protein [Candidatus Eisenbacteria bacterium]
MRLLRHIFPLLLLVFLAPAARGQYVFLDANGDGVNDNADQLPASGSIDLDVWFVTDQNRDGSPAVCGTDPTSPMTINTYEIVLDVRNGEVAFGPMQNLLPMSENPVRFASRGDTTNATTYHNGWGDYIIHPAGRYRVARLTVNVLSGAPSLIFRGRSTREPVDLTAFGTKCSGIDNDNTAILGEEFFDAGGIGRPAAVAAAAGGTYHGVVGQEIQFNGGASVDPDGDGLTYQWAFDDGGSGYGKIVMHAFTTAGNHTATLTVSSPSGTDVDVAQVIVGELAYPIADAGGPYRGETGVPVQFNGSRSSDPDGDPLSYEWDFGNGEHGSGALPHQIYNAPGVYDVTLVVSDGEHGAADATTATIETIVRPENRAPVASAGGPYAGIVNRWIQFSAAGSSDADDDFLSFLWTFGDGSQSPGIAPVHAYLAAGAYTAHVVVTDGKLSTSASASVSVAASSAADAFLDGDEHIVNVDATDEFVVVRFEPDGGSFAAYEVDVDNIVLRVTKKDDTTVDIPAAAPALIQDDSDHDGVAEFVSRFPRAALLDLVESGDILGSTPLEIVGGLYAGGVISGPFHAAIVRSNSFDLTVTPNPFNPTAHIILNTRADGPMTARLFDIRGRHVKTILRGEPMRAGRHDLVFEARDDGGTPLASGLYFLQVTSREGTRTGRVVVAK